MNNKAINIISRMVIYANIGFCLTSCTIIETDIGTPFHVALAETELHVGKTHYRHALYHFGPPAKVSVVENGLAFLYEHTATNEKQIGIGLEIKKVPVLEWFKLAVAWGEADRQALLLIFDDQGLLRNQRFNEWQEDLSRGQAIQFFFAMTSLVDTARFQDEIWLHQWGFSLTRPLPQTLNTHQSLNTGISGLELQSTPTKVGQHTLEMR